MCSSATTPAAAAAQSREAVSSFFTVDASTVGARASGGGEVGDHCG